jgi:hypothetical protein
LRRRAYGVCISVGSRGHNPLVRFISIVSAGFRFGKRIIRRRALYRAPETPSSGFCRSSIGISAPSKSSFCIHRLTIDSPPHPFHKAAVTGSCTLNVVEPVFFWGSRLSWGPSARVEVLEALGLTLWRRHCSLSSRRATAQEEKHPEDREGHSGYYYWDDKSDDEVHGRAPPAV